MTVQSYIGSANGNGVAPHAPRRRAWLWPVILGGIIVMQLGMTSTLIIASTTDRAFAVEPNSYQKAARWNEFAAQRQANAELGWSAALVVTRSNPAAQTHEVRLQLADRDGAALTDATVEMEAFPHARAMERLQLPLNAVSPGAYAILAPLGRLGTWEFRFVVHRGATTFTHCVVQDVN